MNKKGEFTSKKIILILSTIFIVLILIILGAVLIIKKEIENQKSLSNSSKINSLAENASSQEDTYLYINEPSIETRIETCKNTLAEDKDSCFYNLALMTRNVEHCTKITDINLKNYCEGEI